MKTLLKNAREKKGMTTRALGKLLGIDQALICKFEKGTRKPTFAQVEKLATILEIDYQNLLIIWLKEKIIHEIGQSDYALKAIDLVKEELENNNKSIPTTISKNLQDFIEGIETLKKQLLYINPYHNARTFQALELEYVFESNKIESNDFTLQEVNMVINKGLTISGKTMREHLELINHNEALRYIKQQVELGTVLNEQLLLSIHAILLRGINTEGAGTYRKMGMTNYGHNSPALDAVLIQKEIENLFNWFEDNKTLLHPIIIAAEMHLRLVLISPFLENNGETSRLLMNFILLQNGYVIANIKGDDEPKLDYFKAIEKARNTSEKEDFLFFIAQTERDSLIRFLEYNS